MEATHVAVARGLAKLMDEAITIPGTNQKIGLDALLGLIPGIGDIGASAIGGYIVLVASNLGVPQVVLWRMMLNLGVDAMLGLIPFVGDILDIGFKANVRNAKLLTQALAEPQETRRSSRWALLSLGLAFLAITATSIIGTVFLIRWLIG
jgi:hypothetical protein